MTVRLAERGDEAVIAGLRHRWAEEQAGAPIEDGGFAEVFHAWFEREHEQRLTWLAHAGGEAVGMLNMLVFTRMPKPDDARTGRPGRWGYVANAYVADGHRDAGIGALLLGACTAHADRERYARLVLSPSERSVPFYARHGFEPATSLMVRRAR
ncbi:GNAT family N-acetyltransferase [Nocardioides mesophilus]|uniref:GNAT family N-acetyltransferase n=1 Tax=Nocardioides mesophilus TaxID=433659 RepID=UPI001CB6B768|nr:GNAT family N-acetyltransferase [Nocardioides mesophilus]